MRQMGRKLHGAFEVLLKIGRQEISIKRGCKVRQEDNHTLTLLIIVVQLGAVINKLIAAKIDLPRFKYSLAGHGML